MHNHNLVNIFPFTVFNNFLHLLIIKTPIRIYDSLTKPLTDHLSIFCHFKDSGKTVREINRALLDRGIFGGKDLSRDFPDYTHCALYCVTEIHTRADIDKLAKSLSEVLTH